MTHFFLSPPLSVFSPRMYREVRSWKIGKAFGYLAYLTGIFAIFIFLLYHFLLSPKISGFLDWFVQATPEMTLTEAGLETTVTQPYVVQHPVLGPLYVIDTTKELDEMIKDESDTFVLIGKNHLVVRNPEDDQKRVFKYSDVLEQYKKTNQAPSTIKIDKKIIQNFITRFQSAIVPLAFLFLIPVFFLWKLTIASFCFLFALLLNLIKKEKMSARALFSVSCFVITPASILQAVSILIPQIPVNIFVSGLVTLLYLVLALFVAFPKKENPL